MSERFAASPRLYVRIAGVIYAVSIVLGVFGALASGKIGAYADAANLVANAIYLGVVLILYYLLRPVSIGFSALAAFFGLVVCVMGALDIFHIRPFHVNYIVYAGLQCMVLGYLIIRSTFFPKAIGVLLLLAGLNYLTFLSHALAHRMWPYSLIPGLIAEGSLTVCLILGAIKVQRWREQAGEGDAV